MVSGVLSALLLIRAATQSLSPDELGLWSFSFSTVGYFLLLEFGVSSSLGRLFADPVANRDNKAISGWMLLAIMVLSLQAIIVFAIGFLLKDPVIDWFDIPKHLVAEAKSLWMWLIVLQALSMPGKVFPGVIFAQNRVYHIHLFSIISDWVKIGFFYAGITMGSGVMSYAYAAAAALLVTQISYFLIVFCGADRIHFHWVAIPFRHLRELFSYSGAIFVGSLATQAIGASQGMIITKLLGLDALAIFTITSRLPKLASDLVLKPFNAASSRWVLQYCGDQKEKFRGEYSVITRLTLLTLGTIAFGAILVNGAFVKWWTKTEYYGGDMLTVAICLALFPVTINQIFSLAFHLTKQMAAYTYALLGASIAEFAACIIFVKQFGLIGIPYATLAIGMGFSIWFHIIVGGKMIGVNGGRMLIREALWIIISFGLTTAALLWLYPLLSLSGFSLFLLCCVIAALCTLPLLGRIAWLVAAFRKTQPLGK